MSNADKLAVSDLAPVRAAESKLAHAHDQLARLQAKDVDLDSQVYDAEQRKKHVTSGMGELALACELGNADAADLEDRRHELDMLDREIGEAKAMKLAIPKLIRQAGVAVTAAQGELARARAAVALPLLEDLTAETREAFCRFVALHRRWRPLAVSAGRAVTGPHGFLAGDDMQSPNSLATLARASGLTLEGMQPTHGEPEPLTSDELARELA